MLDSSSIFLDSEAFIHIKEGNGIKTLLEISWCQDRQLNMTYYNLFNILERRKEWLHPVFRQSVSVSKGKYSFNLKQYCRVTILLKSFDVDIKQKANVFSTSNIQQFLLDADSSIPCCIVRKTIVCLAYYGGLRLKEMMDIADRIV